MGTVAYWLSRQEKVEVEEVIDAQPYHKYTHPTFRIRRSDGSTVLIERRDILLQEELKLIDELAHILYHQKNPPAKHARYADIMRYFLLKGVPYVTRLQMKKPVHVHQQMLDLYDAG